MLFKVIGFLTAVATTVCGGYFFLQSSFFNLSDMSVNYTYASDYIVSLNKIIMEPLEEYKGQAIWKVDLKEIEKTLKNQNWIQTVTVSRRLPSTLLIEIQPKEIVANLVTSPTKIIPVSEDSELLPETSYLKAPDVPLLTGKVFVKNQELRERALALLKELPREGALSYETVSEVVSRENNFGIKTKNSNALILMNSENVSLKAARVSKVVDYLLEKNLDGRVIDSNFTKKVLVKLRNDR